jgi:PDDEXK-like domain of unknown function (DUF3799)
MIKITPWDGKPISVPGWYSDVPIEKYHSAGMCVGPAVSSSNLRKTWSHSVAHMNAEWAENPDREEKKPTRAMILGQAAHHLFLGEDEYSSKYVVHPETYPDRKTGEPKKWHNGADHCKAWNEKWSNFVILDPDEVKAIKGMAASLTVQPIVQTGLLRGFVEASGFFFDRETELWVKVRPDVIPNDSGDFADLKTTSDPTTIALMHTLRTYGYHMQGALIWEACEALDREFRSFNLLFVETTNPYCARTCPLDAEDLSTGRQQNRSSMIKIRRALDTKRFPGPDDDFETTLRLSNDERERIRTRLKLEGLL